MICDKNPKGLVNCTVHSSTHEKKTRTTILQKKNRYYLQQNALNEDMPVCVIFKAMGYESDQSIVQLIGQSRSR